MSRLRAVILCCLALAAVFAAGLPRGSAKAHPLGNFTVNHSTTITVEPEQVLVRRVLDLAEIPAFQVLQDLETDPAGVIVTEPWAAENAELLREAMTITVGGKRLELRETSRAVEISEGDGGLQVLRLEVDYAALLPEDARGASAAITYADTAYADRIGWREVIARGAPGVDLAASTLPDVSPTNELAFYPDDLTSSPPDVREASFSFAPGEGAPVVAPPVPDQEVARRGNPDSALDRFEDLIAEKDLSVGFVAVALLTAAAFGAIHALSPGHGKTVVAAYLVGSRGTMAHAALLGLTVTITHTSSVYAIGLVTLYLQQYIVPEDLYPWMTLISAAIILGMGLLLLWSRLRAHGITAGLGRALSGLLPAPRLTLAGEQGALAVWPSHQHGATWHQHPAIAAETLDHHHHGDDAHHHDASPAGHASDRAHDPGEPHSHGFGPAHAHAIPGQDGEPVTWQRLLGLGIFGGMIPCPSAIVVMLSAVALHRVGFGLVLIVAFSVGLAAVLTGIGFLVVWAQRVPVLQRAMDRAEHSGGIGATIVRALPVVAALLVTGVGLVMTSRALTQL